MSNPDPQPPPLPDGTGATDPILALERPHPRLLTYYTLCCLVVPPAFPILFPFHYFRYHTMRYRFDAEGISMRWGILFRREVLLRYNRIQDLHLVSNVIERWLGLGRIQVQTASGSATPEMVIEGFQEFEAIRDFLYARMRGTRDPVVPAKAATAPATPPAETVAADAANGQAELAAILREVAAELRSLRESQGDRPTP